MNETTFCELRRKEVINVCDGKRLGPIIDIVFESCTGRILGVVVPGERRFFSFKSKQDIFIPYHAICKFGEDVILVDVTYKMEGCVFPGGSILSKK